MKKTVFLIATFILTLTIVKAQYLFPEKFSNCSPTQFCLDCGDIKAKYSGDIDSFFSKQFEDKNLKNIEGSVFVQILIDTAGKPCVLSIGNKAVGKLSKLDLAVIINSMTGWKPAFTKGKAENVSIKLRFDFMDENCKVTYDRFNPDAVTNMKSVGETEITNTSPNSRILKNDFEVYTTQNSVLPWDMTRSISVDSNNVIWLGTDNGIVKVDNNKFTVFNSKNSPLRTKWNQITIMNSAVDIYNNKWFTDNEGNVYKYDGIKWTVFDSANSPIKWKTGVYADKFGNVWFLSHGLIKYDGKKWSVMDTSNSKLPTNAVMGVFIDSKKRMWIGTQKGNIRIDSSSVKGFASTDNPLKTSTLMKGYEDKNGNIWFSLYEKYPQTKGFAKYSATGNWSLISTNNSKIPRNDVLDFAINEKTNTIWFSINRVGISQFDGENWATYTPENSKVPSTYIQSIAVDKNGNVWCATFAGLLKITPQ